MNTKSGNLPRRTYLGALWITLSLILWASCTSKTQTPTEQVTDFIHQGIKAMENNQIGDVTSLLSETYQDPYGRNQKKMKRLVFFILKRGRVTIFLENLKVRFENDMAFVDCELIGLEGRHKINAIKDLLPKNAKRFKLELQIAKEKDQWKLRSMSGDGFHSNY
jgi:hypothetical protein